MKDPDIDHFLSIEIPSSLKGVKIDKLQENVIQGILTQWKAVTTSTYRMRIFEKEQVELIQQLPDISILNLPDFIREHFKDILALHTNGYWLSTIATVGVICEYLTKYFFPKKSKTMGIANIGGQAERIKVLVDGGIINEQVEELLIAINKIRNASVHLDTTRNIDFKYNSFHIVSKVIKILAIISFVDFSKK